MPDVDEAVAFWNEHGTPKLTQRTPAAVARYFEGLELLEPGVVSCSAWRAATPTPDVAMYAGVGRKRGRIPVVRRATGRRGRCGVAH